MDELPISDLSIHGNIQGSINMDNGEVNNPTNDHIGIKYTLPGSLHFLQTEWARFESERSKWDVEKAELEVDIIYIYFCRLFCIYKYIPIRSMRFN